MTLTDHSGDPAAIVTGVSRGLGAALAAELLGRGFAVIGIGRADNPVLTGERYVFVQLDLSDTSRIDPVVGSALKALKQRKPASICLVNNAASVDVVGPLGRLCSCMRAHSHQTSCRASSFFKQFHREGQSLAPAVVASKMASRLVVGEVETGRTYRYQDL